MDLLAHLPGRYYAPGIAQVVRRVIEVLQYLVRLYLTFHPPLT